MCCDRGWNPGICGEYRRQKDLSWCGIPVIIMVGPERFVNCACVVCMDISNGVTLSREGAIVARLEKRGMITVYNRVPRIQLRIFLMGMIHWPH